MVRKHDDLYKIFSKTFLRVAATKMPQKKMKEEGKKELDLYSIEWYVCNQRRRIVWHVALFQIGLDPSFYYTSHMLVDFFFSSKREKKERSYLWQEEALDIFNVMKYTLKSEGLKGALIPFGQNEKSPIIDYIYFVSLYARSTTHTGWEESSLSLFLFTISLIFFSFSHQREKYSLCFVSSFQCPSIFISFSWTSRRTFTIGQHPYRNM